MPLLLRSARRPAPVAGACGLHVELAGARRTKPEVTHMPEQKTIERARADRRAGKSASTSAGEFVREEIHHVREGKHGARSAKQAIAIGLSKARRAGVRMPLPRKGASSARTRARARSDAKQGRTRARARPSRERSKAVRSALRREGRAAGSHAAISRQVHKSALRRSATDRSRSARKAARTRARGRRSHGGRRAS